jgi:hypothetical protein
MTKRALYLAHLRRERITAHEQGNTIIFERDGQRWLLHVDEQDWWFFRLELPEVLRVQTPVQRIAALVAANRVTARAKVAKVTVAEDTVSVSAEMFLPTHEEFKDVLQRTMRVIADSAARLRADWQAEQVAATELIAGAMAQAGLS